MEKCDIKGCKATATVFGKKLRFCNEHASEVGWTGHIQLGGGTPAP